MKAFYKRSKLIALLSLVAIAILSIGNRIGAVPEQTREIREAANEVGIVVPGGITQGQVLRFSVGRLALVSPTPHGHSGGVNLELRVYDANGNLLASNTYVFPQNQNNTMQSSFFDLSAAQLPASAFDNTGRAQLTGLVRSVDPNNPNRQPDSTCGFIASGEVFSIGNMDRRTLIHIAGTPISECNRR